MHSFIIDQTRTDSIITSRSLRAIHGSALRAVNGSDCVTQLGPVEVGCSDWRQVRLEGDEGAGRGVLRGGEGRGGEGGDGGLDAGG